MFRIAAEETIAARAAECRGQRAFQGIFDAGLQFRCHAFIGIETEHPVVAGGRDGELLLRPKAQPVLLNDARPESFGQRRRAVRAAGIDDDDLVGETHALQAGFQLRCRIERDDGNGERLARRGHL